MGVTMEVCKTIDVCPYFDIICMEDVRPISVDMYALHFFSVDISSHMRSLVYYENSFAGIRHFSGKNGTIKTGSYNQVIILFCLALCSFHRGKNIRIK